MATEEQLYSALQRADAAGDTAAATAIATKIRDMRAAPKAEGGDKPGLLNNLGHGLYSGISQLARGAGEAAAGLGSIDRFVERGVGGIRGEDVGAIEQRQRGEVGELRQAGRQAAEYYSPEAQGYQQPEGFTGTLASAAGGLVPYVAAAPLRGAGYLLGATQGAGEQGQRLDKRIAEGGPVSEAEYNASIGLGAGIGLAEGLLPDFLGDGLGRAATRLGNAKKGAALEGGSEFAGSVAQDLTNQIYDPNAQVQVGQAFEGGGAGAILGAATGAMVPGKGGSSAPVQSQETKSAREEAKGLVNKEEQKASRLERLRAAEATATSKSEAKLFKRLADNEEFLQGVDDKVSSLEEAKAEFGDDAENQAQIQAEIDKLKKRKETITKKRVDALAKKDAASTVTLETTPEQATATLAEDSAGIEPKFGEQIEAPSLTPEGQEIVDKATLNKRGITVGQQQLPPPIEIPPVVDPQQVAEEEAAAKAEAERRALAKTSMKDYLKAPDIDPETGLPVVKGPAVAQEGPTATAESVAADEQLAAEPIEEADLAQVDNPVAMNEATGPASLAATEAEVQGRAPEVQTGKKADLLAGPQNMSGKGRRGLKEAAVGGPEAKPYRGGPVTFDASEEPVGASTQGPVDAKAVADKIMSGWQNPPASVVVVNNLDDPQVPQIVRDTWEAQNAKLRADNPGKTLTRKPKGFFYDGKIYVVGEGHTSPESVARSIYHEAIGHYGVRGAFGNGVMDIYDQLSKLRNDLLQERIKAYGLDPKNAQHRAIAAEEVLAKLAETNPNLGIVKKVVARIRTLLRRFVNPNLTLSDSEIIRDYILPAREFVERGVSPESFDGGEAAAFSATEEKAKPSTTDRIKAGAETLFKKGFESFADRMERDVRPAVKELGAKVREYVQAKQRNYGAFANEFNPAVEKYLALDEDGKKRVAQQFSDYQAAVYENNKAAADKAIDEADDVTVDLILATRKALDVAAKINAESKVEVKDARSGKWRPFKARDNYFPLILKPKYSAALRNPQNPEYAAEFAELRDWAIKKGLAKDDASAREYFAQAYTGGSKLEDFFGNIERSRSSPLPPQAYDFSIDAVRQYQGRWADRAAQIEQFGQNKGETKDEFTKTLNTLDQDDPMRGYVFDGAMQLYGTTPAGEAIGNDTSERVVQLLNTAATGLQLGNPGSAITNLGGGTTLTTANFGVKNSAKAWADLVKEGESLKHDAIRMGIIRDDFLNLLTDPRGGTEAVNDMLGKAQRGAGKMTQGLLKYGGFRAAEDLVRVHAFQASKHNLIDALDAIRTDPNSATAKRFEYQAKKENVDVKKLLAESENPDGPQTETEKYYRKMVNFIQGSYDLDQIPLWVNSKYGRFFFKYYKFITQATRLFYRGHVEPILESKDNKVRTDAALRTLRYMAVAGLGGAAMGEAREMLFDYLFPGDDLDRTKKALSEGDTQRAVASLADLYWEGVTMSGGLGLIGQGGEMVEAITQAFKRPEEIGRLKNPIQAPGFAPIGALVELGRRAKDQGQLTASDYHDVAKNAISMLRTGERLGIKALGLLNDENYLVKKQTAEFDRRYTASRVKEWMDETNYETPEELAKGGNLTDVFNIFGGGIQRGTQTPKNREVREALLLGNGEDAKKIAVDFLAGKGGDKEYKKSRNSMLNSVKFYDPMYIPGNDKNPQLEEDFKAWAQKNLSEEDYSRIIRTTETYRNAAEKAKLWEAPNPREAAARRRKEEREAKRPSNVNRLIQKDFGREANGQ